MRAIIVALFVTVLCLSSAKAEDIFPGPDALYEAVAADVTPAAAPAAPADASVVAPEADDPGGIQITLPFYWEDLTDAGVSLLGIAWKFLFTIGGGWILAKIVGAERAKIVKDAIVVNVDRTWDDMGRELKHELAPGTKLGADAKQKLRNHCTTGVLSILKGAALKLFESYSTAKVNAMISSAVEKRKAIASTGK